ncbi:MAG: uroporphyrinogen-III C-methyltransferase [Desulfomonilaceae bacterium]
MAQDMTGKQLSPGIVYLAGAGPGDPGLITLKAHEKIKTADVVIYDYLAGHELTTLARPDAELIYVGKTGSQHTLKQREINALLVQKAREGKTVVRLKGGDPFLFGRGGEEAEELVAAGIPFEVIPGVTSAIAAPAYAGIPVTHREHASMVTFVTGHENPEKEGSAIDWDVLARSPGSLVFLMGMKNLTEICKNLMNCGMEAKTPAAIVQWGTTPRQQSLVSTLGDLPDKAEQKGVKAPAVIVVGAVASLSQRLAWFETKPLFGKNILVTRTREQSGKLAGKIRELGGQPILFPTIAIRDPDDFSALDDSIRNIQTYDWVVFTSVNGVQRFMTRFLHLTQDIRELKGPRIAAIGPVTAAAVTERGVKVDLTAETFVAEGLIEVFRGLPLQGQKILIPRAEKARDALPLALTTAGAQVTTVGVYRTCKPDDVDVAPVLDMLEKKAIHAVTFTSSSTVSHFVDIVGSQRLGELMVDVTAASIGPVTTETARRLGLRVAVEARQYTIDGLVNAMVEYYKAKQLH